MPREHSLGFFDMNQGFVFLLLLAALMALNACAPLGAWAHRPAQSPESQLLPDPLVCELAPFNCPETQKTITRKILETAYSQLGNPYRYGGTKPETGFDCSGFTKWVYGRQGIKLPRTPQAQFKAGKKVNKEDLRPGDLVFYRERPFHAGMYVGNGLFIHSPHTGDRVKLSKAFDRYHARRFAGARRFVDDPAAAPLPEAVADEISRKALAQFKPPHRKKKAAAVSKPADENRAGASRVHVVQKGDTLWALARRFGVSVKTIKTANNLNSSGSLKIGRKLIIPSSGEL